MVVSPSRSSRSKLETRVVRTWPGLLVGIRRPARALAAEAEGHLPRRLRIGPDKMDPKKGMEELLELLGYII